MNAAREEELEKDITASRRLFYGGFAALPWLWLLNWIMFGGKRHRSDHIAFYVNWSFRLMLVFAVGWAVWIVVFYVNLHGWGQNWLLFDSSDPVYD